MIDRLEMREFRLFPRVIKVRAIAATLLLVVLASCASQGARDAEIAAAEAQRVAFEQQATQLAAEQERARAAALQQQRERTAAARARVQAERDAAAQARTEQESQQREAAEQRERARVAAIAAAEAERQAKLDRIAQLEQQIASIQTEVTDGVQGTASMALAIQTAEELLAALTEEQAKYENTDAQGNTAEPLAKDLIAELESRKNELVRQARSQ